MVSEEAPFILNLGPPACSRAILALDLRPHPAPGAPWYLKGSVCSWYRGPCSLRSSLAPVPAPPGPTSSVQRKAAIEHNVFPFSHQYLKYTIHMGTSVHINTSVPKFLASLANTFRSMRSIIATGAQNAGAAHKYGMSPLCVTVNYIGRRRSDEWCDQSSGTETGFRSRN